jgi:Kef-type K+ transport system membrane component KefB
VSSTLTGLVDILLIVLVARLLGLLCVRVHQPPVIGEMIGGILLGPTLLGWIAPELYRALFPPPAVAVLGNLSQLGLVLFMFTVGANSHAHQREQARRAGFISAASIVVPFAMGYGLGLLLAPAFSSSVPNPRLFSAFLGAAMSVTAFPVLARILTDRGMLRTPMGTLAIACAAVDDVAAWLMLAAITALATGTRHGAATWILFGAWVLVMVLLVRPLARAIWRRSFDAQPESPGALAFLIVFAIACGAATEWIGMHALFGAFFAGVMMPRNPKLNAALSAKVEPLVSVLLLPLFFAFTGLRTNLGALPAANTLKWALAIIAVAMAGKLAGAFIAARLTGVKPRDAAILGLLMNTRGLVELVVLNVGLDLGILPADLFSIMVLMAVITTVIASPGISVIERCCPNNASDLVVPGFGSR